MSRGTGGSGDLSSLLRDLPFGGRQAAVFDRSVNVPPDTQPEDPEVAELQVPFDGVIPYVDVSWPDGAQSLAGIQIRSQSRISILPFNEEDGFISNNDYATRFPLNLPVRDDDVLEFRYANVDSTEHKITAIVTVLEIDGTS
jgi:hypothetical protein